MASIYKSVEYNSAAYEERTYYKNQNFSNTDEGISSIQFRSESLNFSDDSGPSSFTISGSHYNFLNNFLFDPTSFTDGYEKIFTNKFHPSGSVIYIPQQYYGEQIKVNTFKLTDNSTSKTIIIQDDGRGNLYSNNAQASRSAATSLSSSENYVGNIHYQTGIVMITETGSWSGSGVIDTDIMYTDVGTGNYTLEFNSTMPIHQNEIICNISKNEFTATGNNSIWSGSGVLQPNISSSLQQWSPYATQIAFYDRPPNIFGEGKLSEVYELEPGDNIIIWNSDDLIINSENIPQDISQIVLETGGQASSFDNGMWVGNLYTLTKGTTYVIRSTSLAPFNWSVEDVRNGGVPLIVGNFPRPVKIDKESDLTIIIRYDT